jgi:CheY-like chemotaxis protein
VPERKKILIIDDERDFCLFLKENLEETGEFVVLTCQEPLQAEEAIGREKPDLILLDNVMPKKEGSQIVQELRKNPDCRTIPIVMISGRGEMVYFHDKERYRWLANTPIVKNRGKLPDGYGSAELAKAYGVNKYVAKPFSTENLLQVIRDLLDKPVNPEFRLGEPE